MKLSIFLLISLACLASSCKKYNALDKDCGCTSSATVQYISMDGFPKAYNAWLVYISQNKVNAWFISLNFKYSPPGDGFLCKICNQDLLAVKAFTDTASGKYNIPVKIKGEVKEMCKGERPQFGLGFIPENMPFVGHIIIDSIKAD